MKEQSKEEFAVGDIVQDKWWKEKTGPILSLSKNKLRVRFPYGEEIYDRPHFQFLRVIKKA